MEGQDDVDALVAQMEREYEEEEKRKKAEKKNRKKGVTKDDEAGGAVSAAPAVDEAKPKKEKKPKKPKEAKPEDDEAEKPAPAAAAAEEEKKPAAEPASVAAKKKSKDKEKAKETKEAPKPEPAAEAKPQADEEAKSEEPAAASSTKKSGKDAGKGGPAKKKLPSGISALKDALAKAKEKEDELLRLEEEKIKKEEEARQKKLELERLEKEKKLKKKQKEKERIQRLKQEGKYETKEQKEAKQRALLQLQALGVRIPLRGTENEEAAPVEAEAPVDKNLKKPKYGRLRKKQAQGDGENQTQEQQQADEAAEGKEGEDDVKDSWDAESVKDEWDAESEDEKPKETATKTEKKTEAAPAAAAQSSESEDSDEESDAEGSEESESDDDEDKTLPPMERVQLRLQKIHDEAEKLRTTDNLRAPVICVLGHVDTGKTKILDNLRRTKVQEDEAGGITQQIGATNVPYETVSERTKMCRSIYKELLKIPGFLIIDTPGHESFKSLRTRGSSLCDIAILVIDIMHGLEPQTIESINILKEKKTPFLVALNKIDRLFGWKSSPQSDVIKVLESQAANTKSEFETRTNEVIVQLAEQGLNAALFYKNPDIKSYISLVPTSAHTSDGIGNLMALITEFSQTILAKRVSYSKELQCTVMEVKTIPGLGTTIDVCLVNGSLKVCDTIVVPGQEGPIVTQIRGLLLPQPNRDLRSKNSYINHKEVKGAQGVKIAAKELEKAMAGLPLFVARKDDEIDYFKNELQVMLKQALSSIKLSDVGVFVQASTLGSLEALLEFLRTSKIPYAGISIGPVHKKDITMASIMLEKDPQYAVILAFDVKVERDAQDMADHVGVKVFTADIIYHLFDKFMGYRDELKAKKREEFKDVAVFPCKLKIMPEFVFNTRDPIICGVKVEAGFIKVGSPLCAMCLDQDDKREGKDKFVDLGKVSSIEYNHKPIDVAKQGQEVCIKIENTTGGAPKLLGRHFLMTDPIVSKISRESIDAVKNYFREEMSKSDWQLIIELKKQFQIL